MKTVKFDLIGNYGHFKIPYTNNNPLTYSFITKTALIGMIGAVIGIERRDFRRLFPLLSDNLKYSLSINNELIKQSISTYAVNFNNISRNDRPNKSPRPMEYIKDVDCTIYLACDTDDSEIVDIFEHFIYNIENGFYAWKPTLGIKSSPCDIINVEVGKVENKNGVFKTKTFIKNIKSIPDDLVLYSDNIPTHQDENWFNDPKYNIDLYFTDNKNIIESEGDYYVFNNENIVLI